VPLPSVAIYPPLLDLLRETVRDPSVATPDGSWAPLTPPAPLSRGSLMLHLPFVHSIATPNDGVNKVADEMGKPFN
jgi:hypothetical protein